jgi:hypothetical protein
LRSAATTLGNFFLGRACVFDSPVAGDDFKLGGVSDQHARDLCILRVLGLGRAEKGLEGDQG